MHAGLARRDVTKTVTARGALLLAHRETSASERSGLARRCLSPARLLPALVAVRLTWQALCVRLDR